MMPGILSTILGLVLVYLAVLLPGVIQSTNWYVGGAGIAIILLAYWSRTTDVAKWHSTTNIVLGALLLILYGTQQVGLPLGALFIFWWIFWVGLLVALFALWAVIYRPRRSARA
jgi:hypothetical protein